jgi:hypothetical protein
MPIRGMCRLHCSVFSIFDKLMYWDTRFSAKKSIISSHGCSADHTNNCDKDLVLPGLTQLPRKTGRRRTHLLLIPLTTAICPETSSYQVFQAFLCPKKRKVYAKLLEREATSNGQTALLIEGVRHVKVLLVLSTRLQITCLRSILRSLSKHRCFGIMACLGIPQFTVLAVSVQQQFIVCSGLHQLAFI